MEEVVLDPSVFQHLQNVNLFRFEAETLIGPSGPSLMTSSHSVCSRPANFENGSATTSFVTCWQANGERPTQKRRKRKESNTAKLIQTWRLPVVKRYSPAVNIILGTFFHLSKQRSAIRLNLQLIVLNTLTHSWLLLSSGKTPLSKSVFIFGQLHFSISFLQNNFYELRFLHGLFIWCHGRTLLKNLSLDKFLQRTIFLSVKDVLII